MDEEEELRDRQVWEAVVARPQNLLQDLFDVDGRTALERAVESEAGVVGADFEHALRPDADLAGEGELKAVGAERRVESEEEFDAADRDDGAPRAVLDDGPGLNRLDLKLRGHQLVLRGGVHLNAHVRQLQKLFEVKVGRQNALETDAVGEARRFVAGGAEAPWQAAGEPDFVFWV